MEGHQPDITLLRLVDGCFLRYRVFAGKMSRVWKLIETIQSGWLKRSRLWHSVGSLREISFLSSVSLAKASIPYWLTTRISSRRMWLLFRAAAILQFLSNGGGIGLSLRCTDWTKSNHQTLGDYQHINWFYRVSVIRVLFPSQTLIGRSTITFSYC